MNYQSYTPHSGLASLIRCYWTLYAPAEPEPVKQRIVPDGCMEMIFQCGDVYRQYLPDGSSIVQPKCFVFGQITSPLEIEPTGVTDIFAVRFYPDGFLPFSQIPLRELENRAVPVEEIFGEEGSCFCQSVLQAISVKERIGLTEAFLLKKLGTPGVTDRVARESVQTLFQCKGQVNVAELADQLYIQRRQLERRFSAVIGMSPKQLSKIIRLNATLKMMAGEQYSSLTSLAYENGYYDQAHFIKDFKEFTGISPKQFYADSLQMSALFIGTA